MYFPDDVLALIREFASPLKRRIISKYWVDKKRELYIRAIYNNTRKFNYEFDYMADIVFKQFKNEESEYAVLHTYDYGWKIIDDYNDDDEYDADFIELKVVFNKNKLLKWNGLFEEKNKYDEDGKRVLGKDTIMYKQLLQNGLVVKEKIDLNP